MIREIKQDELDLIDPILTCFSEEEGAGVPPNFTETVKKSVKEGKAVVYGAIAEDGTLTGIGTFGNESKGISFIYTKGNFDLEVKLVDMIFNIHTQDCSRIMASGRWVTEAISDHLIKIGFRKLDRAFMTIDRAAVESLELPSLTEDMKLEVYDDSQRDEVSKVMFKGNDGHIDQIVFPMFFGSIDDCAKLIVNIMKNVYGEYKKPYSWLLKENGKIIGACIMTIRKKGAAGYIPDIVIDPDYQGEGLGKILLIHSMKEIVAGESDIVSVDLDMTLENDARFLYRSVGYETVREYSIYAWIKE